MQKSVIILSQIINKGTKENFMNELISIINQVSGGEPEEIIYDLQSVIQNSTLP